MKALLAGLGVKSVFFILFLIILCLVNMKSNASNSSCGLDRSVASAVYEGVAAIEDYPWMGLLYYPRGQRRFTTSVVLVTRQMVIAAAGEIDRLPKTDFRIRSRVVLGHKCGVGSEIKIRDYTYHPEYIKNTFSALTMVQLETDHVKTELRPICQPPQHFTEPLFFAMTLTSSCKDPKVRINKMEYVEINECKNFYRRSGLDQGSMWPVHSACARAVSGGRCVWRSGSVLAVRQAGRWRLLGFSVYGPGCGDPARFLDYGLYHQWVRLSSSTVGLPAITRMGEDHIVMRRSLANLQRFGPCDKEEEIAELYTDKVLIIEEGAVKKHYAKYNITIYANTEYSCVTFRARPHESGGHVVNSDEVRFKQRRADEKNPQIHLRRWCATSDGMCHGFQFIEIDFYVEIVFYRSVEFSVYMYGQEGKVISVTSAMKLANVETGKYPEKKTYPEVLKIVKDQKSKAPRGWFYSHHVG